MTSRVDAFVTTKLPRILNQSADRSAQTEKIGPVETSSSPDSVTAIVQSTLPPRFVEDKVAQIISPAEGTDHHTVPNDEPPRGLDPVTGARLYTSCICFASSLGGLPAFILFGGDTAIGVGIGVAFMILSFAVMIKYGRDAMEQIGP